MSLSSDQIRQRFIDYFVRHGHEHVASGSLVPPEDPTLLFTNAGMNQFKGVFLGETSRENPRAVTSQKCMRVSGKHNDLETVGPSLYHHTFFEMLGNFSFGDYFKQDAIRFAWELFTEGFGLEKERLWATVYLDDDEAAELWVQETDLPAGRVLRLGAEDNYWSMGDTGPCGPCSELHYDYEWDGSPIENPDMDSDRFVELWNLVFMQFNQSAGGEKTPLPNPSIDTGAGLERLTAVLQGTRSNYDTDLFRPVIDATAGEVERSYGDSTEGDVALRVIADHGRAMAFLLADGIMPANEGRGYVLRRLLRRAMRFGMKIGFERPFLNRTALAVVDRMRDSYPELEENRELIERVVLSEEERFLQTLAGGSNRFNELVDELRGSDETVIPGGEAFKLYDTFGLPLELAREFATAEGMTIDEAGFQEALEGQRQRARAAWKGGEDEPLKEQLRALTQSKGTTESLAWETHEIAAAEVVGLLRDGEMVDGLPAGATGGMVVDSTPFYAESGGQVGDTGSVSWEGGRARVLDTRRPVAGVVLHRVEVVEGELTVGARVRLGVDDDRRRRTRRHHTATHLLHAALRDQLGEHVRQAGSLVEPDRLRFDFTHYDAIEPERLERLERAVNAAVLADTPLSVDFMAYAEAIDRGALAFFGEKYGERVRVVSVPGVSTELCGGTHVDRTGEIGPFLITREESVAAGTRRIEAVAGEAAHELVRELRGAVRDVSSRLRVPVDELGESLDRLSQRAQEAEREAERLRVKLAAREAGAGVDEALDIHGVKLLRREVEGLDSSAMRNLSDELRTKLGSGVIVLAARREGKAAFIVTVTEDLTDRIGAGDVVRELAQIVGGGGGGRRDMAQAGGPDATKVSEALDKAPEVIRRLL